jgi:hypothetical protein
MACGERDASEAAMGDAHAQKVLVGHYRLEDGYLLVTFTAELNIAAAVESSSHPDLRGQWIGILRRVPGLPGQPSFDPAKPWGRGQEAPLTPEYQAILDANLKAQTQGALGNTTGALCLGFGMPIITYGFEPMEFVVTPEITYVLIDWVEHTRRIYTDGRDWPAEIEPTMPGYSIGRWVDDDNDGHYDVLEVETRGFKGPRYYDAAGVPLRHTINPFSRSASTSIATTRTFFIMR